MDITCPRCGARIPAEDANIDTMAAKCRACNAVFSIADRLAPAAGWPAPPRGEAPLPERFVVERPGGALRVSWRWFTPVAFIFAGFGLFWSAFICVWIATVLAAGASPFALFGAIHAIVGAVLIYTAAAMFLNTTRVDASYGSLTVRHGPLPWPGNQTLPTDGIRQIYGVERVRRSRRARSTTYDLQAVKGDGSAVALLKGLTSAEQALYLEQEIERFLGIKDAPIPGELPR